MDVNSLLYGVLIIVVLWYGYIGYLAIRDHRAVINDPTQKIREVMVLMFDETNDEVTRGRTRVAQSLIEFAQTSFPAQPGWQPLPSVHDSTTFRMWHDPQTQLLLIFDDGNVELSLGPAYARDLHIAQLFHPPHGAQL